MDFSSQMRSMAFRAALCLTALSYRTASALPDWIAELDAEGQATALSWGKRKQAEVARAYDGARHEREVRADRRLPPLPPFPSHSAVCAGGRPCRPGEGNTKGYKMWQQPYEHREHFVQTRRREPPANPDYSALLAAAKAVAIQKVVILAAADFDYRELALNWVAHVRARGHANALLLAMDSELVAELSRRGIAHADNSANLAAWNATCLQRHVQAVRTERHVAAAALVAASYDVLLCDVTAVFSADPMPYLLDASRQADVLFQRDDWPAEPNKVGLAVNSGFVYYRGSSSRAAEVARLIGAAVDRGLIEFYLRWNNIVDQYGWSFVLQKWATGGATSEFANETTIGTLKRNHCMRDGACLSYGLLPWDKFPRHYKPGGAKKWAELSPKALIFHMTVACAEQDAPCGGDALRTFKGNRQRLDRYDETDFVDMANALRAAGAWMLDTAGSVVLR